MNRKILIPAVALIALLLKEVGDINLSDAQINVIVEGLLGVTAIVGIFMNPKKGDSPAPTNTVKVPPNDDGGGDSNE